MTPPFDSPSPNPSEGRVSYVLRGCSHCDGWHRGEPCPTGMCDHYIEIDGEPFAGTYCKLLAGHEGPHSPLYWDEQPVTHELGEGDPS